MPLSPAEAASNTPRGCLAWLGIAVSLSVALAVAADRMGFPEWVLYVAAIAPIVCAVVCGIRGVVRDQLQSQLRSDSPEAIAATAVPVDPPASPSFSLLAAPPATGPTPRAIESSDLHGVEFGCLLILSPIWIALTCGPTIWMIFKGGFPRFGVLFLFSALFMCGGLWLVWQTVRAGCIWYADSAVGPLLVELSDYPLRSGGRYRLRIDRTRAKTLDDVLVELIGTESVTWDDSEGDKTTRKAVVSRSIVGGGPGSTLPLEIDLTVPESLMPSFGNEWIDIGWCFRISARFSASLTPRVRFGRNYRFEIVSAPTERTHS